MKIITVYIQSNSFIVSDLYCRQEFNFTIILHKEGKIHDFIVHYKKLKNRLHKK